MIPNIQTQSDSIEFKEIPSKNYKVDYVDRIYGQVDDLNAMKQTAYRILLTERYQWVIYDWNYGIELNDLFGEPISYVIPVVQSRIIEALTYDDRIESVDTFTFDTSKRHELAVSFVVHTKYGNFEMEKEINV